MRAANIEDIYQLSPMQQGMLFHSLYAPDSVMYFLQWTCELHGELRPAAFKRAWQMVQDRHSILRTSFHWANTDKPLQLVHKELALHMDQQDWRGLASVEQQARLETYLKNDRERRFDLTQAPLMRLSLIRVDEHLHYFVWSHHHLLLDGWSFPLLLREVFAFYRAISCDQRLELEPAPPYRDYIAWLQQQDHVAAEAYWREYLRGFTTPTPLGIDRSPGISAPHREEDYERLQLQLSTELTKAVQQMGRRYRLTTNTIVQSAWALLLARYSRQPEVVYGVTVSGRPGELSRVEQMVGLFINTLPVRVRVEANEEVNEWLKRQQAEQVELRQYEYSALVEVQGWSQVEPGQPLFESVFALESYDVGNIFLNETGGLRVDNLRQFSRSNAPLAVQAFTDQDLLLRVTYDRRRFDDATVSRMLQHLRTLLEAMTSDPSTRLSQLPLLSEAETQQLLYQWNDTHAAVPSACIHQLFEQQVELTPDAIALIFEGEQVTYRELNSRANQLAHYLMAQGVGAETLVGLCVERSVEMVVGMLGVLKAGGAYVPLDVEYPAERLQYMLEDAAVPLLLTQERLLDRLPAHWGQVLCLDSEWEVIAESQSENPKSRATTQNLAYVIYTSGSTGWPKGVMVTHHGFHSLHLAQSETFSLSSQDRVLQFSSFSFDASVFDIVMALLNGATLYLGAAESLLPGPALHRLLQDERITNLTIPPSSLAVLPADNLPHLHTLVVAGERCPEQLVEQWSHGRRFFNAYGPTEASIWATVAECSANGETPPIGKPIANVQVYVLDEQMQPVPVGITGELYIGGAGLARGYLSRPQLTAERFVPHPFSQQSGARLYRSGDLVRWRQDGELEYVGRIDEQVKVRGYRIEIGEVEAVLRSHPSVSSCVVTAREEESGERRLVGYVVSAAGEPQTKISELRRYLGEKLPEYMIPAVFIELDELPLTVNGKVDRRALLAPTGERLLPEQEFAAPRSRVEEYLAQIWSEVLGVDKVGIHDNFFALGGDSLKAAVMVNRLQEELREIIYFVALFDAPTVAELASYLSEHYGSAIARVCNLEPANNGSDPAYLKGQGKIDELKVQRMRQLIVPLPAHEADGAQKNPTAVFVLSPPRSGSTLLRVMLGGHPLLFAPPELELLDFNTLTERKAAFEGRNSFWLEGAVRALMEINKWDATQAGSFIESCEDSELSTRQFYRLVQDALGEKILVDKTPAYSFDLETLKRAEADFENPIYIHLLRHPCGMIHSFEKAKIEQIFTRYQHPFTARELAELLWVISHQNILEFLQQVPAHRQYRLNFEQLLQSPRQVMEEVCQALKIEFCPDMLQPYKDKKQKMTDGVHAVSRMIGDPKFNQHTEINATVAESWKEYYSEDQLGDVTRRLAESLGYSLGAPSQNGAGPASRNLNLIEAVTQSNGNSQPLSYAQQRLWFLERLEPGSPLYICPGAVRLVGRLDVLSLERALNEVIRRHGALRTTFTTVEKQPVQIVHPPQPLQLPVFDLTESEEEPEAAALRLAMEEAHKPFDLARGPLLRVKLLRLGEQDHVVLFMLHHIISDGWSMGILVREVATLYEAFGNDRPSPLPELAIQYTDFAVWQRQLLEKEELQSQLDYWKRQLRAAPAVQRLPADRPRPEVPTYRGARAPFILSRTLAEDLKTLAKQENVTLFISLLAAFQTLLSYYTDDDDIVVGTDVNNRNRAETQSVIGFFVNQLVLRTDFSGNPTFRELLGRVREVATGAYAHQDLPFDILVDALKPQRSLSYTPLFQVKIVLQNPPAELLKLPNLTVCSMDLDPGTSKFDLTLAIPEMTGELHCFWEYSLDLFNAATVERMTQNFQTLLYRCVAEPDLTLSQIKEGLAEGDKEQQLIRQKGLRENSIEKFKATKRKAVAVN